MNDIGIAVPLIYLIISAGAFATNEDPLVAIYWVLGAIFWLIYFNKIED